MEAADPPPGGGGKRRDKQSSAAVRRARPKCCRPALSLWAALSRTPAQPSTWLAEQHPSAGALSLRVVPSLLPLLPLLTLRAGPLCTIPAACPSWAPLVPPPRPAPFRAVSALRLACAVSMPLPSLPPCPAAATAATCTLTSPADLAAHHAHPSLLLTEGPASPTEQGGGGVCPPAHLAADHANPLLLVQGLAHVHLAVGGGDHLHLGHPAVNDLQGDVKLLHHADGDGAAAGLQAGGARGVGVACQPRLAVPTTWREAAPEPPRLHRSLGFTI